MSEDRPTDEKRKLVRRELIYYLKVTDRHTGREVGRIGDIHAEGILILAPGPLPKQTVYRLLLELPKTMASQEGCSELAIEAQVAWNQPGPQMGSYHENGCRFLELSPQTLEAIGRLTEIFAMPGNFHRNRIRFSQG
jgi:hypothetical protein